MAVTRLHEGKLEQFVCGVVEEVGATLNAAPVVMGVAVKLERGACVADDGCSHGSSTVLISQALPRSAFVGSDHHAAAVWRGEGRPA